MAPFSLLFFSLGREGEEKKTPKNEEGLVGNKNDINKRSACERGRLFEISPPLWGPGK